MCYDKRKEKRPPQPTLSVFLFFVLFVNHFLHLYRQSEKVYKAFGILLIVIAFAEGCNLLAVKRIIAPYARIYHVALIELELNVACNSLLSFINKSRKE